MSILPKKRNRAASKSLNPRPKPARQSLTTEGFARSKDGTRIWYKSEGKGTPIIYCNGLGCSPFFWKHIHNHFKQTNQSILFDWRGHGKSEMPRDSAHNNMGTLTEDLHAVISRLKLKKIILAGHSMGTMVIFNYARKHPKKIKVLFSCCGTYGKPLSTFYNNENSRYVFALIYIFNHLFPRASNAISYLLSKNPFWFQMGSALKMLHPGLVDKKLVKEYIEHFTSVDPVFLTDLAKNMQDFNAEPFLKDILSPVMIIAGEKDTFTPVWLSKRMHHLLPDSELLIIREATHIALIEQSALINLRLEKFIYERL